MDSGIRLFSGFGEVLRFSKTCLIGLIVFSANCEARMFQCLEFFMIKWTLTSAKWLKLPTRVLACHKEMKPGSSESFGCRKWKKRVI